MPPASAPRRRRSQAHRRRPPLVDRALRLAREAGFDRSCRDEDGWLLHLLAGRRGVERPAEIGCGCGVGAAWIVSALRPSTPFVTVELDPNRAAVAGRVFVDDPGVSVLVGDWRTVLPAAAPFDFLFVDAREAKDDPDAAAGLLLPGATVLLDDFTAALGDDDPRRRAWLEHADFAAAVLGTGGTSQVIVATRL